MKIFKEENLNKNYDISKLKLFHNHKRSYVLLSMTSIVILHMHNKKIAFIDFFIKIGSLINVLKRVQLKSCNPKVM